MNVKERAKKYHEEECYIKPVNDREMAEFAEVVLREFIEALEDNVSSAVCNGSLKSVLFIDNGYSHKSFKQIKEEFLCQK